MLTIVAPGQGAQTPGFLAPWLELPGMTERFAWWSAVSGLDLIRYGTTADAEEIRDTAVAQPLLVSAGLAAWHALVDDEPTRPDLLAGHSVGEFVAASAAGVLTEEAALVLIRERGAAMAKASAATETGMTAVLGGDRETVLAAIDAAGLTPANDNGAGQIVAAGTLDRLAGFAERPPAGARLRALRVAGAFHTEHMASAVETLRPLTDGVTVADPVLPLLSNADGAVVGEGRAYLDRLLRQVVSPVRWAACMDTMLARGTTALLELPPAGTLTGIARRAMPGLHRVALKTPDDLPAARELLAEHAGTAA